MVIRIASVVLNLAGLLALISGLLYWIDAAPQVRQMHMLLGLLAVGALWVIGMEAFNHAGSRMFAALAVIVGTITLMVGLVQSSLMPGEFHWVVSVVHLLLGILTIGVGHMGVARYRKRSSG